MQLNHFLRRLYLLKPDARGCWLWRERPYPCGAKYAKVTIDRRSLYAHRAAWSIVNGLEVPEGMDVCHSCDTPLCVNPAHLWLGTRSDNMKDAGEKGRLRDQRNPRTHCKRGHEFTPENTARDHRGDRVCIECRRWHRRQRWHRVHE